MESVADGCGITQRAIYFIQWSTPRQQGTPDIGSFD